MQFLKLKCIKTSNVKIIINFIQWNIRLVCFRSGAYFLLKFYFNFRIVSHMAYRRWPVMRDCSFHNSQYGNEFSSTVLSKVSWWISWYGILFHLCIHPALRSGRCFWNHFVFSFFPRSCFLCLDRYF